MIHVPRIPATIEAVEERMRDSPIQRWVDPRVILVTDREVRFEVTAHDGWFNSHPEGLVHGGLLATLLDMAATYSLVGTVGTPCPTIDLQIHYLEPALPGTLVAVGRQIRSGGRVSVAESEVHGPDGKRVAIARGTFVTVTVDDPPVPAPAPGR